MEEMATYRRRQEMIRESFSLIDKLIILLRTHKDIKLLCTRTSVALRIASLCDLLIKRTIGGDYNCYSNGAGMGDNGGAAGSNIYGAAGSNGSNAYGAAGSNIYGMNRKGKITSNRGNEIEIYREGETELEKEIINKMRNVKGDIKDWFKALNGEKEKEVFVKNFRKKVYRDMESRGLIRVKKGLAMNKIILVDQETWGRVIEEIINECERKILRYETIVLLVLINYVNQLESLRVHCNIQNQRNINEAVENAIGKIKGGMAGNEIERNIFGLLRGIL